MAPNRYAAFLPDLQDWIHNTLDAHAAEKRPVISFKFKRLPRYFPADILNSASVVVIDDLPRPPLVSLGLSEFAAFECRLDGTIGKLADLSIKERSE